MHSTVGMTHTGHPCYAPHFLISSSSPLSERVSVYVCECVCVFCVCVCVCVCERESEGESVCVIVIDTRIVPEM